MPRILETPNFKNEQEEAEWWDSPEGRAAIEQGFEDAEREGTLTRGTLKKRGNSPAMTMRMDSLDIELAKGSVR